MRAALVSFFYSVEALPLEDLELLRGVSVANETEQFHTDREIVSPRAFEAVGELDPGSVTLDQSRTVTGA